MQGKGNSGGISSVCWFLYQFLSSIDNYKMQIFSLETAYNNPINVRLLSPKSWFRGIQIIDYSWHNITAKHVGANFSELEFQRYMPRRKLTNLLNKFDLIQVVAGGPATANVVKNIGKPICIQIANLVRLERNSMFRETSFPRRVYGRLMLPIVSIIERQALNRADHIFADTEYTRQAIIPYVEESRITIDTIGVNTNQFRPILEEQRRDNYLLSVGRFNDARKNVVLLFEAYALIRQLYSRNPPKLILAGENGPNQAAWAKAKRLGITEQIIFKENIPINELIELYQNAAVFVLTSNEEGLGIVLLEALACATPVVSTHCGGPDSVITDNIGFLSPVGDAQALAERLMVMLQNPVLRRDMGRAGRKMVKLRYSNEVVGKKYLDIYNKLLGINCT